MILRSRYHKAPSSRHQKQWRRTHAGTLALKGLLLPSAPHLFLSIIEIFIRDPLTIFFTLGAMFIISFKLTIFLILFIPLSEKPTVVSQYAIIELFSGNSPSRILSKSSLDKTLLQIPCLSTFPAKVAFLDVSIVRAVSVPTSPRPTAILKASLSLPSTPIQNPKKR